MAKRFLRLLSRFIIALLLAICLVLGVAPVVPKKEEKTSMEIVLGASEENEEEDYKKK